jgi:NADPH2:quinone reductase
MQTDHKLRHKCIHEIDLQRVFVTGKNSGAYAEYIVSESVFVFPLDERLSFAQGAALGTPYFTAYKALIMGAQMKPGEMVLVHGVRNRP